MTDKRQSDALRQAAWLKKEGASCQRHYDLGVLIERQHTEVENLREKLKTYEDLGDAGSDVQLLRMGYAAARLEIESLKSQLAAQQPGVAYAALPEPITYQIAVLKACEHGDALVGWRVEPSRQSFDASMRPKRKLYTEGDMHDFADRTHAMRASHGQAPAQAAPAAVAGCTRSHPHENMDSACRAKAAIAEMRNKAARGAEATAHDLDRFVVMLTSAPTTQPAPQQGTSLMPKGDSAAPKLRAMATNYPAGHQWDKLDAQACIRGALEIEALRSQAPQQEAQEPYSIDADPQGIRATVADAITGALAFGAQGTNAPPDGHWLAPFWAAARAEREAAPQPSPTAQGCTLDVVLDAFENKTRGIPQAHIAAALVAELRAAIEAASTTPTAQVDVPESEYRRGYRHGYEQRDAEVRGALV